MYNAEDLGCSGLEDCIRLRVEAASSKTTLLTDAWLNLLSVSSSELVDSAPSSRWISASRSVMALCESSLMSLSAHSSRIRDTSSESVSTSPSDDSPCSWSHMASAYQPHPPIVLASYY